MVARPQREKSVAEIHQQVDSRVEPLQLLHQERLQCRLGCQACCIDDLTVFEVEAWQIQQNYRSMLRTEQPHAEGKCAFLDSAGGCRIYDHRPYVCRTQGLPLRWLEENQAEELVEYRDICPLNEEGPPLEDLPEDQCWTIGPVEGQLAALQQFKRGDSLKRVTLRSLWVKNPGDENRR